MKTFKIILFFICVVGVVPNFVFAETLDKNTILQLAQGDKLVLKKDLNIPANTDRLYFGVAMDSGFKISGCALVFNPSLKSRKMVPGTEVIFSGVSEKKLAKNYYGNIDYTFIAGVMNSDVVSALECYGTSFESNFKDLYVSGMKQELKEFCDFVPAEPEIVH